MEKGNYRWNKKCNICSEWISDKGEHICRAHRRKVGDLFHCAKCKQYLSRDSFHKDITKPYGIMSSCKKCRKPTLSRQNNLRGLKKLLESEC